MSFIELSYFYKNFAELYSAGIDLASIVEALKKNQSHVEKSHRLQLVVHNLKNGRSLHQSFKNTQFVPVFDLPLVKAAEESGRLVEIFKNLSRKYNDTHEAVKKVRQSLFKPYFTLTAALLFPGIPDLFSQKSSLAHYLKNSVGVLLFITAMFYFIYSYWVQSFFDLQKARTWNHIISSLPFFKKLSHRLAIEKFSSTLAMMLESGIDFFEALKQAGQCSSDIKIQNAVNHIIPRIQAGADIDSEFRKEKTFPIELINAISLGSQSGKLPEFLNRYAIDLKNQNDGSIQSAVKIFPIVLYWIIVGQIAYSIANFYTSYLNQVLKIAP